MKKLLSICIVILLTSCDDGDIIVTSFEFDDATLEFCEGAKENEFVFFKINRELKEAISFNFISPDFSGTKETEMPIAITIDGQATTLIYRQFNMSISSSYYCNTVPPSDVVVTEELTGTQGDAEIKVTIVEEDDNDGVDPIVESGGIDPTADPDGDGVPNYLDDDPEDKDVGDMDGLIEDGFDTDGDGIPNFKDQDDDNDNILTSVEFPDDDPTTDLPLDSDNDMIPDYLDPDDDNDGVLTRNEDADQNQNPRDDNSGTGTPPNYLNGAVTISTPNEASLDNTVLTTFRTSINIVNLKFNIEDDNFTEDKFPFGFKDEVISIVTEKK